MCTILAPSAPGCDRGLRACSRRCWLRPFSFFKIPASVGCPDLVRVVSACCLFFLLLLLDLNPWDESNISVQVFAVGSLTLCVRFCVIVKIKTSTNPIHLFTRTRHAPHDTAQHHRMYLTDFHSSETRPSCVRSVANLLPFGRRSYRPTAGRTPWTTDRTLPIWHL